MVVVNKLDLLFVLSCTSCFIFSAEARHAPECPSTDNYWSRVLEDSAKDSFPNVLPFPVRRDEGCGHVVDNYSSFAGNEGAFLTDTGRRPVYGGAPHISRRDSPKACTPFRVMSDWDDTLAPTQYATLWGTKGTDWEPPADALTHDAEGRAHTKHAGYQGLGSALAAMACLTSPAHAEAVKARSLGSVKYRSSDTRSPVRRSSADTIQDNYITLLTAAHWGAASKGKKMRELQSSVGGLQGLKTAVAQAAWNGGVVAPDASPRDARQVLADDFASKLQVLGEEDFNAFLSSGGQIKADAWPYMPHELNLNRMPNMQIWPEYIRKRVERQMVYDRRRSAMWRTGKSKVYRFEKSAPRFPEVNGSWVFLGDDGQADMSTVAPALLRQGDEYASVPAPIGKKDEDGKPVRPLGNGENRVSYVAIHATTPYRRAAAAQNGGSTAPALSTAHDDSINRFFEPANGSQLGYDERGWYFFGIFDGRAQNRRGVYSETLFSPDVRQQLTKTMNRRFPPLPEHGQNKQRFFYFENYPCLEQQLRRVGWVRADAAPAAGGPRLTPGASQDACTRAMDDQARFMDALIKRQFTTGERAIRRALNRVYDTIEVHASTHSLYDSSQRNQETGRDMIYTDHEAVRLAVRQLQDEVHTHYCKDSPAILPPEDKLLMEHMLEELSVLAIPFNAGQGAIDFHWLCSNGPTKDVNIV